MAPRTMDSRPMTDRQIIRILCILLPGLLAGMVTGSLQAGMIYSFEPSVEIGLIHDGDVFRSSADTAISDQLAILRPLLPLVGQSERTTMSLSYAPEAEFYSTYSDLNRMNHLAELAFNRILSRRGSFELGGSYLDTSDSLGQLQENDLITVRSNRQMLGANAGFTVGVSQRVNLAVRYALRDLEYEDPAITGNTSHVASVAADLVAGPRSSIALDYAYQYFVFPERGDYGTHNLLARYSIRPTQQTTLTLAGGVYYQDYQPDQSEGAVATQDDTGFVGRIEWGKEGARFSFSVGASREVRASGGIDQSVLAHDLRLSISGDLGRRTSMRLSGTYQHNEPSISSGEGTVEQLRASLNLDYEISRHFGLRFYADYIDQRWEVDGQRDLSYPRVGLSLVISTAAAGDDA